MGRYRENYTIFKRGKYWYYRTYDSNDIRTTAHSTGQTSKVAARMWCEQKFKSGSLNSSRVTYGAYSDGFYSPDSVFVKTRNLSVSTLRAYSSYISQAILPYWKNIPLCDITITRIEKYFFQLKETYSDSARGTILGIMRNVFKRALREGLIARDPTEGFTVTKKRTKRDSLTLEEMQKILENTEDTDAHQLFLLLALTGLRVGEALAVTPDKVIEEDGKMYLHISATRDSSSAQIRETTKTGEVRDVPTIPGLWSESIQSWSYTFYSSRFREAVQKVCPDYKERKLSIHSIRHFFITQTKVDGLNPLIVETVAGHSLRGMADVYTNFHKADFSPVNDWQQKYFKLFCFCC